MTQFSNRTLLNMVESWDDPRGEVSPTAMADREFHKMNVAALKAKADEILKSSKRKVVTYKYSVAADGSYRTDVEVGEIE